MSELEIKVKIRKWNESFIKDENGSLIDCFWNQMAKDEIEYLTEKLKS